MTLNLENEICLISKEPIVEKITLPCKHSFEYYYLYEEIKQQKQRHKSYFKCPYCRTKFNGTIPYYEIDDIEKINYINNTNKTLLPILKCITCNLNANKYKNGIFCMKHYKNMNVNKCSAICKNGNVCKNNSIINNLCNKHNKNKVIKNSCLGVCKNGVQCKKYSILNTNYCNIHKKIE